LAKNQATTLNVGRTTLHFSLPAQGFLAIARNDMEVDALKPVGKGNKLDILTL
jgi:hypothetical protein